MAWDISSSWEESVKNMPRSLIRTALIYDFDGTLVSGNVQEHSFLPELGIAPREFWDEVKLLAQEHDADEILIYMWRMLERARGEGFSVRKEEFAEHGRDLPLFEGLDTWFNRINSYAEDLGLDLEHHIISSGTQEMIDGCSIRDQFTHVFASKFVYDGDGVAVWPGLAINYTNKTQFLFRINKGIENSWDNSSINKWMPLDQRPVPFPRMIFLGDGETDIPSMKMVRHQGGHSVAVFDPEKWQLPKSQSHVHRLIAEDRADFTVPADYREGSQLSVTVKGILGRIAVRDGTVT
jgi:hypothetical protein